MTDEQEMELHEELKWAKIEAEQAHVMVAALQEKVERLRTDLEEEQAATEALEAKLKSESNCACSYDGVDDICMCHSPKLVAAVAENERLRTAMGAAIKEAKQPHYGDKYIQLDNYDDAILTLEKALEDK